jgi:hypothetical protein
MPRRDYRTLLTQKSIEIVRVEVGGQNLDRDSAIQFRLQAAIDDPKAAAPDFLDVIEPGVAQFPGDPGTEILLRRVWIALGTILTETAHYRRSR